MPKYRLIVVGTHGGYLVDDHNEVPDERVDRLTEVLAFMSGLELSTISAEPCYRNLNPSDQRIIEGARRKIIRDKSIESKADSST